MERERGNDKEREAEESGGLRKGKRDTGRREQIEKRGRERGGGREWMGGRERRKTKKKLRRGKEKVTKKKATPTNEKEN